MFRSAARRLAAWFILISVAGASGPASAFAQQTAASVTEGAVTSRFGYQFGFYGSGSAAERAIGEAWAAVGVR